MGPLKGVDGGVILTAPRVHARLGLRIPLLRAGVRHRRRSGHRLGALRAGALLGRTPGRPSLTARQVSKRGGTLQVAVDGDRVRLTGHAVTVLSGELLA